MLFLIVNFLSLVALFVGSFVSFQRVGLNLVELLGTELDWEDLGLKYNQKDVCMSDLKLQPA